MCVAPSGAALMSSMTGCSFSAPGLLAMPGVHQSVRVPSPAPVYMCVCLLPHYGMYVCVCVCFPVRLPNEGP